MDGEKSPIQVFCSEMGFDAKKVGDNIKYDRTYLVNKPSNGGLWTSSLIPEENRIQKEAISGWAEWCIGEQFRPQNLKKVTILYPKEDTKVYTIDSLEDLYWASGPLYLIYPDEYISMKEKEKEWYKNKKVIDFPSLLLNNDGIRVTERAARAFHLFFRFGKNYNSAESMMMNNLTDLNAWDCESTFWRDTEWIDHTEEKEMNISNIK